MRTFRVRKIEADGSESPLDTVDAATSIMAVEHFDRPSGGRGYRELGAEEKAAPGRATFAVYEHVGESRFVPSQHGEHAKSALFEYAEPVFVCRVERNR